MRNHTEKVSQVAQGVISVPVIPGRSRQFYVNQMVDSLGRCAHVAQVETLLELWLLRGVNQGKLPLAEAVVIAGLALTVLDGRLPT